jgi:DNA mismatch endonuclease (patch repair protein)
MENRETRSRIMRAVKGRDTGPEMIVRRLVHSLGYRYRLHRADLPGKPDLAFPSRRKAIFVHGCFWHGHSCARGARVPKTNTIYWSAKIGRNRCRDANSQRQLRALGWEPLVVWECETRDAGPLADKLSNFIGHRHPFSKS